MPETRLFFELSPFLAIVCMVTGAWLMLYVAGGTMASATAAIDELPLARETALMLTPLKLTLETIEPSVALTEEPPSGYVDAALPEGPLTLNADRGQQAAAREEFFEANSLTNSTAPSDLRFSILRASYRHLGTRYRWGGTDPSGFDCSGFVQYVMAGQGIALPRTARAMQASLPPVALEELKPGDLVFFMRPDHVGIYIGQGRFIHASSGDHRVTITDLTRRSYTRRFVGAARVFVDGVSG